MFGKTSSVHVSHGFRILAVGVCLTVVSLFAEVLRLTTPVYGQRHTTASLIGLALAAIGLLLRRKHVSQTSQSILRVAVPLLSLVIALLAADVFMGILYQRWAPGLGKRNVQVLLGEVGPENRLVHRTHPYLLYENTPNYVGENGLRQANAQGYRNSQDFSQLPPADALRVLTLGGSTTYGEQLDGPDDAWPAQLQALLTEYLQETAHGRFKRAEVLNAGLSWATSAELLSHYMFRCRYCGATLVVIHTGGNDAWPLLFHDYDPEYTHFRQGWGVSHRPRRGEVFLIQHSNIARWLFASWLSDGPVLPYPLLNTKSFCLPPEYYEWNARANEPVGFERNTDFLVRNILGDGSVPVFFPFIQAPNRVFESLTGRAAHEAAFTLNSRRGSQIALEKNVTVLRKIAENRRVTLIEFDANRIPPDQWLDHCHLGREGERAKAQFVAAQLQRIIESEF